MSDQVDRRPGGGGALAQNVKYRDEGDGSWSESVAALQRAWDAVNLVWVKLLANPAGYLQIATGAASTATLTSVATSNVNATLLASNTSRLGAVVFNDSANKLYVKFGATASSSSFSYLLYANESLEVPYGYTGRIDGILDTSTGNARVTELTA